MSINMPKNRPDPAESKSETASFRHNLRFRVLLSAVALGAVTTGILSIATDLVAIYALGASATEIGILNAASSICFLVFGIPAGILVDRFDRQPVMVASMLTGGAFIGSIPIAWLMDALTFPHLLLASFIVGLTGMLFGIASGSVLPAMVAKDFLATAFSRRQTVESAAEVAMPGLTGLLVGVIAAPFALVLAAGTAILSALTLILGLRGREPADEVDPTTRKTPLRVSLGEGISFTLRHRPILLLIVSSALLNVGLALGSAVETVYYVRSLAFDPALIGFLFSVAAIGGLVGSLIVPPLVSRWGERRSFLTVAVLLPILVLPLPLASILLDASVVLVLAHVAGYGALVVAYNALAFTILARLTPPEMMGRQQGFRIVATMGLVPFAGIIGGLLGDSWGLTQVMWTWVAISAMVVIPVLLQRHQPDSSDIQMVEPTAG